MAKGSNNARSKKTHSSKPYDVSNSFVRKVASRVTSLLPQPSWLSKWFVSSNEDDKSSVDEQPDTNLPEYRSSKRPKIDVNRSFPTNSFRVAPACDGEDGGDRETTYTTQRASVEPGRSSPQRTSNQLPLLSPQRSSDESVRFTQRIVDDSARFSLQRLADEPDRFSLQRISESSRHTPHKVSDEPVAGPSGLNKSQNRLNFVDSPLVETERANSHSLHRNIRPRPSLSVYLNQSNSSPLHMERKMNGDNLSESSESTSGCSSLPNPTTQRAPSHNKAPSENKNYVSPAISHSQRSLLLNRTRSPRINTPLSRRRTLFSVSAFGSPSVDSDSSLSKSAVLNSPFYAGRTGYGGASAHSRSHDFTPEVQAYRPSSIEVHPINSGSSNSSLAAMSHTTRRIMEALEQFASPAQNTRKILVDTPSLPVLATKRPCIENKVTEEKTSLRQLTIPTVPDLIKLRRREKLQDSIESARLIANAAENTYQLRVEDNSRTGKVKGRKTNIEDEETVKELNLPSISLPITVLPKFDIEVPSQQQITSLSTSTFKFSLPYYINDVTRTETSTKTFTFSAPLNVSQNSEEAKVNKTFQTVKEIIDKPKVETQVSDANGVAASQGHVTSASTVKSNFASFQFVSPDYKMSNTIPNFKTDVSKSNIILDCNKSVNSSKSSCHPPEIDLEKNKSVNKSLSDFIKASSDTWECGTCLIRNKLSATRCVACTASRESLQTHAASTVSPPRKLGEVERIGSQEANRTEKPNISNNFIFPTVGTQKNSNVLTRNDTEKDKWECSSCWIKNPEISSKCQACETGKPQEKSKISSSFGAKLSKPLDTWECPTCMIRNKNEALKCAACEEPKPGSAAASTSKSTLKFNIDIPAEASKFSFGVNNSNVSVASEPSKGFKFGVSNPQTAGTKTGFTFGVVDSSSSAQTIEKKPAFTFGIPQSSSSTMTTNSLLSNKTVDGLNNSGGDVTKSENTSKVTSEVQSEKQLNVAKLNPESHVSDVTGKLEKSQSSLISHSISDTVKTKAETVTTNFKFSVPSSSSESSKTSTNLFSFGIKPNSVIHHSDSTEGSKGTHVKSCSGELNGKSLISTTQIIERDDIQKTKISESQVVSHNESTTTSSVPITAINTSFSNKDISIKSPQAIKENAISSLPDTLANKNCVSLTESQKIATATHASDSTVSSPGKISAAKSLFSNSTPQSIFGTTGTATNVCSPLANSSVSEAIQTSSEQQTPAVNNVTVKNFAGNTASQLGFTSVPVTTAQGFGSTAVLSLTSQPTTLNNFGSDKPVMSFGSAANSNSNPAASAFASTQLTSPGSLFGAQKLNSSETAPSTFGSNTAPNFGTPAGNLTGFGTPATTSQPFGLPATTPAFGLVTPSFGAASPQNFGSVTTSAPSFGSSLSGPFNAKPPIDATVKVSSTATPFGFSSNPSSAPVSFTFGSAQSNTSELSGPAAKQPNFTFGNASTSTPVGQSPGFSFGGFASNSMPSATGEPAGSLFGTATSSPAFGSGSTSGFTAPSFFGQTSQPNTNMFGFSSNQDASKTQPNQNAVPAFSFSASQPSAPPTFNPNVKPSFNFTGGSTTNFTADATASPPPTQRRIKKAFRRTQARTNVM